MTSPNPPMARGRRPSMGDFRRALETFLSKPECRELGLRLWPRGRTHPALPCAFAFLVGSSAPQNVPGFGLRGLVFRAAHFGQLQALVPVDVQRPAEVAVIELASM